MKTVMMNEQFKSAILQEMAKYLTSRQLGKLENVMSVEIQKADALHEAITSVQKAEPQVDSISAFLSAKRVEGCSEQTIAYYQNALEKLITCVGKNVCEMTTADIRNYLSIQQIRGLSKVTIDNLRRIFSSLFSWLEDEDYITKSPIRRIHRVKTDLKVKRVLTDENIETLHDGCTEPRDLAIFDLLLSTGMRVGEMVRINRTDIDFQERRCVVFGKGNKEREVYFNARTKLHLQNYLDSRTDDCPALFVSLTAPYERITISGVEMRIRVIGKRLGLGRLHPHLFRRTFATMAIDKGMPIEQVQQLLGHVKIDTTLHYAMVNQTNVRNSHRKFMQ